MAECAHTRRPEPDQYDDTCPVSLGFDAGPGGMAHNVCGRGRPCPDHDQADDRPQCGGVVSQSRQERRLADTCTDPQRCAAAGWCFNEGPTPGVYGIAMGCAGDD